LFDQVQFYAVYQHSTSVFGRLKISLLLKQTVSNLLYITVTDSVKKSPWEADSHSASQKIRQLLWNTKIRYRVHRNTPLDPNLSQLNPVHSLTLILPKIRFNIILLLNALFHRTVATLILCRCFAVSTLGVYLQQPLRNRTHLW